LRTNEELGFAAFVCATMASLVIGHLCRHYNEHSGKDSEGREVSLMIPSVELSEMVLSGEPQEDLSASKAPPARHIGFALLGAAAFCSTGCFIKAFHIRLDCAVGFLGESSYSLIGFALALPRFAERPHAWSTYINQATFLVFAIAVIHLHMAILLIIWYTGRCSTFALALAKSLGAWAALDVALLSMVITLLELRVSDFVHLQKNDLRMLSRIVGMELTASKGLTVDVTLESGTFLLLLGVLLHAWSSRAALAALPSHVPRTTSHASEPFEGNGDSLRAVPLLTPA